MLVPIILAGGVGSRLWPLSRSLYPKQFLPLASNATMLQETLSRLDGLGVKSTVTICNEEHRFMVAEQLRSIGDIGTIILEPVGRNTAPAIALAANTVMNSEESDPLLLVLAADHVIQDQSEFVETVKKAVPLALEGKLVTFGIVPQSAHTGYGYIKRGDAVSSGFTVDKFIEKPDLEIAQSYIDSGEYYWNSGMFLFRASTYLAELGQFRPDIALACKKSLEGVSNDLDFVRVNKEAFFACPDDSVDYAVMEKTMDAVVVPLDAGWNDIGSWSALWEVSDKDHDGNAVTGDAILHDSQNCLIKGDDRLIAAVGLDDIVIVDTKDALLVAHKDHVQHVKSIVDELKNKERNEFKIHRDVYRPWGKYDLIDTGDRYLVKRITVNPGNKITTQMHHHRAEHWIVVSGTAQVTNGDKKSLVTENESIYIPIGSVHALENPGKVPLELVEIQSGSYLGEDDIVRFQESYDPTLGVVA